MRGTGGIIANGGIKPIVGKAGGRLRVSVGMQKVPILGIEEKLQQRVAVRSRSAPAILGREEEEPDQRQDPEWRYPARKPGFCPQAWHEYHRQELTAKQERKAATLRSKVPRSRGAPRAWTVTHIPAA